MSVAKAYFAATALLSLVSASADERSCDLPSAETAFEVVQSSATTVIPAGTYRVEEGGIRLKGLRDAVIDARGVTLLASDHRSSALTISDCENLTLRGFTLDYDPLPFTQGTITAVDPDKRTVDIALHAGYPALSTFEKLRPLNLFDPDGRWKIGVPEYYMKKIEDLGGHQARAYFSKGAGGFDLFTVGDKVAMNVRGFAGIKITDCSSGIRLENVTIYAAPGIAVIVRFAEDGGALERVRVVPGPPPEGATEPRLLSSSADALNVAYTRGGLVVSGCEFSHMGDDSINLHGVALPVLKWIDHKTFLTMRPYAGEDFDKLLHAGDEIHFLSDTDYSQLQTARLAQARKTEEKAEDWADALKKFWPHASKHNESSFFVIELQEPVADVPAGSYTEVPATNASGFTIHDNYFHDHRARGLRLMSTDGVVENNRFERIKGVAISLGPQFTYWAEAGWCSDITIRGNTILDVGEGAAICSAESETLGAISIACRMLTPEATNNLPAGNHNITITDNLIDGCSVAGISVSAARDVVITDNTIRRVNQRACPEAGSRQGLHSEDPITVIQAEVTIEGNTVE